MRNIFLISTVALILTGCANGYTTYYKPLATSKSPLYVPSDLPIQVKISENIDLDTKQLIEDGYLILGVSKFIARSGSQNLKDMEKQAALVGAQVVLASKKNLGSTTIAMPLTTPTTNTSTTNYNLRNNYGSYVTGSAQTTSYGTQTQYVPITISDTEYAAYFFAKFKNKIGIFPADLTDLDKKNIEQNGGMKVGLIINNSPAYYAGVLKDDIILKINDKDVYGVNGYLESVNNLEGEDVKFTIYRSGKILNKNIKI